MAFQANYEAAILFIILGAAFDFFDGMLARLLGVSGPLGKELDSLADDITFGLAPATIVYSLLRETAVPMPCAWLDAFVPYAAFLIAAFSALRLAKFNIDERQASTFYGLPTPANALFWSALAYGAHDWLVAFPHTFWLLLVGIVLSCYILVADIPMFALKFKSFGWQGNGLRYSFIVAAAALLLLLGWSGFSVVIVLYILLSLIACRVKA
jgi:CDP-diacylglycerol--serine O-phosphatidyltransferase